LNSFFSVILKKGTKVGIILFNAYLCRFKKASLHQQAKKYKMLLF